MSFHPKVISRKKRPYVSRLHFISIIIMILFLSGGIGLYVTGQGGVLINTTLTSNPDLDNGLVGHWTFDGTEVDWASSTISDKSGNGLTLVASGGMDTRSQVPGPLGQALRFNGVADALVPEAPALSVDTSNITTFTARASSTDWTFDGATTTHTVSAGTDLLVVFLQGWYVGDNRPPTSITWNGSSLTRIDLNTSYGVPGWGNDQSGLWYLESPTPAVDGLFEIAGGDPGLNDGGVAHVVNVRGVDTTVGVSGIRDVDGTYADIYTTITHSPTTATGDLVLSQWSQQGSLTTTGQTYGGTSGTQTVLDGTGFWYDAAFLTSSLPTGSGQTVSFLGTSGSTYPSGVSLSIAPATSVSVPDVDTVAFWLRADTLTESIIQLSSTASISLSSGTLTATGLSSPTIYVDGVVTTSVPDTEWHHVVVVTASSVLADDLAVGSIASNYFQGSLDDVRIYNRVLSADEITRLYGLGATTHIATTITSNTTLESGLVGHWTFDGMDVDWSSTTAEIRDRSGNANHGDAQGGMTTTSVTPGVMGQGMSFDGVDDRITLDGLALADTTYTVALWFYMDFDPSTGDQSGVLVTDTGTYYGLQVCNANSSCGWGTALLLYDGTYNPANTDLVQGRWYHATVVSDAGEVTYYLNGAYDGGPYDLGGYKFQGGIGYFGQNWALDFPGKMDDIRVYERALSAAEVKRLYELGATTHISTTITSNTTLESGLVGHWTFDGMDVDWSSTTAEIRDRSGNGNHGDAQGGMTTTSVTPGVMGQGMSFDGVDDVIDMGDPANGTLDFADGEDFSITAWFKRNDDADWVNLIDKSAWPGYRINLATSNLWMQTWDDDFDGYTAQSYVSIPVDEWVHFVFIWDDDVEANTKFFVNGQPGDPFRTGTFTNIGDRLTNTNPFLIGESFNGALDDVRIYNRALSAEEVKRLYELGN